MERPNLSKKINEYTTQKLRQEWAEHEEIFQFDALDKDKVIVGIFSYLFQYILGMETELDLN